ncbi:CDP-archaeol synthase [Marinobacter sp. 1_MG-2023]|uniref:CDP-archaeol synthase n=1 Tax=Marinobacter sp. 1_MG-2023 TaxID=3062627 RepID=UPI0026E452AF|nr:CDP-archaeol synthase [Marinobacter sp. 1_MG-2023]MDO6822530.1 CDP-archaeol synthase [Marinobacter sp. 1_MG-2023]
MLISLQLFLMLVLANGAPVVAAKILRQRWSAPVDAGLNWIDGRRLLGKSKTWRGIVSGALSCALFSLATGQGFLFGLLFGLLALAGDLFSSFIKRRLGLASSERMPWLDQVPEAAMPVLLAMDWGLIEAWVALFIVVFFTLSNMWISPLLYRLGIRRHPH